MRKVGQTRRRGPAKGTRRRKLRFHKRKTARSRATTQRRRKRRSKRQRGGKHVSFNEKKWLSKEVDLQAMGRENSVQGKKTGISTHKKTDMYLVDSDISDLVLLTRNNLNGTGRPIYSALLAQKVVRQSGLLGSTSPTFGAKDKTVCEIKRVAEGATLWKPEQNSKVVNVVWVRHCHSCSNAAGEGPGALTPSGIELKMREPLCTALGARQSLHAGLYLNELLPPGPNTKVKFYSSFLPRTFETAKLVAAAFEDKRPEAVEGGITRICNVSEETKGYEEMAERRRATKLKGSQSTTSLSKSESHAAYLNSKIKVGPTINPHSTPQDECVQGLIKGSKINQLACDYIRFLQEQLVAMTSNQSAKPTRRDYALNSIYQEHDTDAPQLYNVIVSHGGYIRHCVLQTTVDHPANTQLFLVKYYLPETPGSPIYADITQTIEMPGMPGSTSEIAKLTDDLNPGLLEELTKDNGVSTDCDYKFHGTIEPSTGLIANDAPLTISKKMETGGIAMAKPMSITPQV